MKLSEMDLTQLKRIQNMYMEIIKQTGKLVIQDMESYLVLLPTAISKEIKEKENG